LHDQLERKVGAWISGAGIAKEYALRIDADIRYSEIRSIGIGNGRVIETGAVIV
jgi:hypothetical protein